MPQNRPSEIQMNKTWSDEIASTNRKTLQEYAPYSQKWMRNALKMEDARFGRQFSRNEEEELRKFRQAPLPISISTAILDTADSMSVSVKPTIYVSPIIHPYDENYSEVSKSVAKKYNFLLRKSWHDSLGSLQYQRVINDSSNVGRGLIYVVPRSEFGQFSVDFKHLSWRYFFPDPSSRDELFQDMDNQIYALPITKKAAFKFVKNIEPDLTAAQFEDFCSGDTPPVYFYEDSVYGQAYDPKEDVLFCQRLTLEEEKFYYAIPTAKNINYQGQELKYKTYTMLTDELKQLRDEGRIRIEERTRMALVEYTSVGNYGYKVVYPVSQYNIIPIHYAYRQTPFSYSRMWFIYPLQRALNRFMMSAILNMALLNSTKVLAEEGSIVNKDKWVSTASQPNVVLEYKNQIPGVSVPPEIIPPSPMDQSWLQLPQYLTSMMEYVSGIYGTMQGNPSDAPSTFNTVASLQSAGGQKIKAFLNQVDAALSQAGKVAGEFYKEYAPLNGYSSIIGETQEEGEEEEMEFYNTLQAETRRTEDGRPKADITIKSETDLRRGFRDVRFTTKGSTGYEASTEAAMLTTLATQLGLPDLAPLILERLNISGVDKVMKKVDRNKQLEQATQQLEEQTSELQSQLQVRENQIFQLAKSLEAAKFKGQLDVELTQFKKDPLGYLKQALTNQGER